MRESTNTLPVAQPTTGSPSRAMAGLLALGLLSACACGGEAGIRRPAPVRIPFDSPLHLILVEASIRGQGPFRFLLDTGSTLSVVDAGVAARLGLDARAPRTRQGTAAGSAVTVAPVDGGVTFRLAPDLEMHVEKVIAAPFEEAARVLMGLEVHGILGSAVFRRYVVEVDYVHRALTLHEPGGYRYRGSGTALELDFPDRLPSIPFIEATIVNGDRRLTGLPISVDSGGQAFGTASLGRRTEWNTLVSPEDRVVAALSTTGLSNNAEGTTHEAFLTGMDRLILGPFEFEAPLVSYSEGGPGFASVGASLLHRFTVVFDYARKRMILEPNSDFGKPPMIDASGMMLVSSRDFPGSFEVWFVAPETPGQRAGLARGDVIHAIDGVPAGDIELNEAREMFCRHRRYVLEVQRSDDEFETTIETRPLFGD